MVYFFLCSALQMLLNFFRRFPAIVEETCKISEILYSNAAAGLCAHFSHMTAVFPQRLLFDPIVAFFCVGTQYPISLHSVILFIEANGYIFTTKLSLFPTLLEDSEKSVYLPRRLFDPGYG